MDKKKIGIVAAVVVVLFLFLGFVWPGFLKGTDVATTAPATNLVEEGVAAVQNAVEEGAAAVQNAVEEGAAAVQNAVEEGAATVEGAVEGATEGN